jgi:hypothetical protein
MAEVAGPTEPGPPEVAGPTASGSPEVMDMPVITVYVATWIQEHR